MRLGGLAAHGVTVTSREQLAEAYRWATAHGVPVRVIGGGSNIVWRDEGFPGLLVVNAISGLEAVEHDDHIQLTVGAGEIWDNVVARSVELGLTGIEALSLIPGSTGATPIQNVGAYGQDISQTLVSLQAFDTHSQSFVTIEAADCGFGYRTSRFKTSDSGRFFITSISLRLTRGNPQPPFYGAVQKYFDEHEITDMSSVTPLTLREAVIAIRSAKLPDPAHIANNGSFFANPIISQSDFEPLLQNYPDIVHWPAKEGVKLSAAWLIEQAGFKDYHDPETGMATWARQPLVLINEHATSTADLLAFKQKIVDAVNDKFGVRLEQEPELLP